MNDDYMYEGNRLTKTLLNIMGLDHKEEIEEFFSTNPQRTYDPFLLYNMDAGVDLILNAVEKNDGICIYGDYDADGITSISILKTVLDVISSKVSYYIPSRMEEGYGLNKDAIEKIKSDDVKLIVTVDCGSTSYSEVEFAKSIGLNVLVTDHHKIDDVKANCLMINPKQVECNYPFPHLAGCGVAFKLAQALIAKSHIPRKILGEVVDLAAIGTVGDVVPLVDENRTIVKHGLKIINRNMRPGLKALAEKTNLQEGRIDSENVAYLLVPHINAAGRLARGSIGVEFLLSKTENEATKYAENLVELNSKRKKLQNESLKNCIDEIERKWKTSNFLILERDDVHEGVAGIVAGHIKEQMNKPVAILTPSGGGLKGTSRSIEGLDLYQLLNEHRHIFNSFGGHSGACGFSIDRRLLDELRVKVEESMSTRMAENPKLMKENTIYHLEIEGEDVTVDSVDEVEKFSPFGHKNERPVFMLRDVLLKRQSIFRSKSDQQYAKFKAFFSSGIEVDCIMFKGVARSSEKIFEEGRVSLTGTMRKKIWRGKEDVQLMVDSIF